jgi:hypothetical protein
MALPWRWFSVAAIVFSYVVTSRTTSWALLRFIGNFTAAWAVQFLVWAAWSTQIYPKLFSPLRHLPEPTGNTFFMGQWRKILAEPSGVPMQEWLVAHVLNRAESTG